MITMTADEITLHTRQATTAFVPDRKGLKNIRVDIDSATGKWAVTLDVYAANATEWGQFMYQMRTGDLAAEVVEGFDPHSADPDPDQLAAVLALAGVEGQPLDVDFVKVAAWLIKKRGLDA